MNHWKLNTRHLLAIITACYFINTATAQALNIDDLPNPMLPSDRQPAPGINAAPSPGQGLKLQSIIHSGQRKSAVINGSIKTVGSQINGGEITAIRHNAVVISHNGRDLTLHLTPTAGVTQRGNQQ
jgi:hypothetical protein